MLQGAGGGNDDNGHQKPRDEAPASSKCIYCGLYFYEVVSLKEAIAAPLWTTTFSIV